MWRKKCVNTLLRQMNISQSRTWQDPPAMVLQPFGPLSLFLKGGRSPSGVELFIGKCTFPVTEHSLQSYCSMYPKWSIRNSNFGHFSAIPISLCIGPTHLSLNFNEGYLMCFGVHSMHNWIDFRVTPSSGKCLPNQNFTEIHSFAWHDSGPSGDGSILRKWNKMTWVTRASPVGPNHRKLQELAVARSAFWNPRSFGSQGGH